MQKMVEQMVEYANVDDAAVLAQAMRMQNWECTGYANFVGRHDYGVDVLSFFVDVESCVERNKISSVRYDIAKHILLQALVDVRDAADHSGDALDVDLLSAYLTYAVQNYALQVILIIGD